MVLAVAQIVAERLEQSHIPPIAVILAMLVFDEPDTIMGGDILRQSGLTFEDMLKTAFEVEPLLKDRDATAAQESLDLAEGTKELLVHAVDAARLRAHSSISSPHLLIGIVDMAEPTTLSVFRKLNVSPDLLRKAAAQRLKHPLTKYLTVGMTRKQASILVARRVHRIFPEYDENDWFYERRYRREFTLRETPNDLIFASARDLAYELKHPEIYPAHYLLALFVLEDEEAELFQAMGLSFEDARQHVIIYYHDTVVGDYAVNMSEEIMHILVNLKAVARSWTKKQINGTHLLMTMFEMREPCVMAFFEANGYDYQTVRRYAHPYLTGMPDPAPPHKHTGNWFRRLFGG